MNLVFFYLELLANGVQLTSSAKDGLDIEMSYNFSNQDTPSDANATIHGPTNQTAKKFKVGTSITVHAGFFNEDWTQNNIAHVLTSDITSLDPLKVDSGDWYLHFTMQGGSKDDPKKAIKVATSKKIRIKSTNKSNNYRKDLGNYERQQRAERQKWLKGNSKATTHQKHMRYVQMENNIKSKRTQLKGKQNRENKKLSQQKKYRIKTVYKFMSFKPGTKGSAIIKKIASKAGIKIAKTKLVYDRPYYNGYTARKKPLSCIRDIAKDCKTDMFYKHGQLVIMPFKDNQKINYVCTPRTGLITPPSLSDDADDKNTYQATVLFNAQINTGSVFKIDDSDFTGFNDKVIVTSGSVSIQSGSMPTMDITFKKLSTYQKQQASAIKKEKSSDAKSKAKLDEKNRKQAIAKRKERAKNRKKGKK